MKILCTGSSGYVGSWLVPKMLADGHEVVGVDTGWFGTREHDNEHFEFHKLSLKHIVTQPEIYDVDAVIHLACLSNNAMCDKYYQLWTEDRIQTLNFLHLVKKVPLIIYASSVAVYGSTEEEVGERDWADLRPTTRYGEAKKEGELAAMSYGACIVRSASVCGRSSNMRFDVTLNKMTHDAVKNGVIKVNGGEQKRCHVTLDDLCDFYRLLLTSKARIKGEAFNVVAENQSVADSAMMVAEITTAKVEPGLATDNRSYTVSGIKAEQVLGWKPQHSIKDAVHTMATLLQNGYWKDSAEPRYWRMNDFA